jgi:Holliday junction resolvase RusA-like endonuclease
MAKLCEFTVWGQAKPQGSTRTRTFIDKDGKPRAVITHANRDSLMQWRTDIRAGIQLHAPGFKSALAKGPVAVRAVFYVTKPPSISKRRAFPIVAPDLDKCARAAGDAFEKTILVNDAQIVHWDVWKVYTEGASKVTFELWEPDHFAPAASNPFAQPGLF